MAEYENPSAGKFGPPPENARRERERTGGVAKAGIALGPGALMIGVYLLRHYLRSQRGWVAALGGLLLVAAYGAQYIFSRQARDARDGGPDPYTPPTNITR